MMVCRGRCAVAILALICLGGVSAAALGQKTASGKKKPVLIRADRTTNKDEPELILPDPIQAERNLRVGDFYFKKKNFKAAIERYRIAIQYGPKRPDSYLRLAKTHEKLGQLSEALETCRQFVDLNPDSSRLGDFVSRIRRINTSLSK